MLRTMLRTVALLVLVGVSYAAPAMQSVSLRRRQQSTCTKKEATKFVDSLPSELGCKVNACSAWGGIKVKCSIPLDTMTKIPLYGALVEAKLEFDFTFHACSQPAGMSIFFGAVALDSATEVLKLAYSKLHIKKEVTTAKSEVRSPAHKHACCMISLLRARLSLSLKTDLQNQSNFRSHSNAADHGHACDRQARRLYDHCH